MKRPDAVAVAVLCGTGDQTRVLLLRRARGAFAGAWTFVMGGVEAGESGVAAARRELREETGLEEDELYTAGVLDAFYDPVADCVVHVPFFVARVAGGREVRLEAVHDEARWAGLADAVSLLEFPSQRRLIAEIEAGFVRAAPRAWQRLA